MLPQLSAEQVHAALPWHPLADALTQAFATPPQAPVRTAHAMSSADTLLLMHMPPPPPASSIQPVAPACISVGDRGSLKS